LCWQTVEPQSIPALAIASAVGVHYEKRPQTSLQERNYHTFEKDYQIEEQY
jgi:hypothetical protein